MFTSLEIYIKNYLSIIIHINVDINNLVKTIYPKSLLLFLSKEKKESIINLFDDE